MSAWIVVGKGSRENAIAWKLRQDPRVSEAILVSADLPFKEIGEQARTKRAKVFIGPEVPLAKGLADFLHALGVNAFGPSQLASRLEASKWWAKVLMQGCGVPTASAEFFTSSSAALKYLERCSFPKVIKADGLAAGKGVVFATNKKEADGAVIDFMVRRTLKDAGDEILIEEALEGLEVSAFAFCDGEIVSDVVAACDYKREGDGNQGRNTGGMGAYSSPAFWNADLQDFVRKHIMQPVVDAMARMGCPFRGVLFAGLILTKDGPRVLEFNCRLGDPEAQVILPRLVTCLAEVTEAVNRGELRRIKLVWSPLACVGVVIAAKGYPGVPQTGFSITGLENLDEDILVFLGGVKQEGETLKAVGGRLLTLASLAPTVLEARKQVYENARRIRGSEIRYRTDVALVP